MTTQRARHVAAGALGGGEGAHRAVRARRAAVDRREAALSAQMALRIRKRHSRELSERAPSARRARAHARARQRRVGACDAREAGGRRELGDLVR